MPVFLPSGVETLLLLGIEEWEAFVSILWFTERQPTQEEKSCVLEFQEVTTTELQKLD